jgi:hypothetical protein
VLIDNDWKLWMIDFSRGFRLPAKIVNEKDLIKADRQVLERIKTLDGAEVARVTKDYLRKAEIEGVMKRRDLIIQHFDKLVAAKGEIEVLYLNYNSVCPPDDTATETRRHRDKKRRSTQNPLNSQSALIQIRRAPRSGVDTAGAGPIREPRSRPGFVYRTGSDCVLIGLHRRPTRRISRAPPCLCDLCGYSPFLHPSSCASWLRGYRRSNPPRMSTRLCPTKSLSKCPCPACASGPA